MGLDSADAALMDADSISAFEKIQADLLDEYRQDHTYPWIIGYSGGKDSTLVTHLAFEMLMKLPPSERKRPVHIVANDTLVESPLVVQHIIDSTSEIQSAAEAFGLPVVTKITRPSPEQSFWVVLYRAPLSQGAVASRVADLISSDPMGDRDTYKRGQEIKLSGNEAEKGLVFRRFFAEDKDWAILKILKSYFQAVSDAFPDLWAQQDNPLSKTIGYGALMSLLVDAYKDGAAKSDLSFDYFQELMQRINSFPAAGSGESKLYRKLREWSGISAAEGSA